MFSVKTAIKIEFFPGCFLPFLSKTDTYLFLVKPFFLKTPENKLINVIHVCHDGIGVLVTLNTTLTHLRLCRLQSAVTSVDLCSTWDVITKIGNTYTQVMQKENIFPMIHRTKWLGQFSLKYTRKISDIWVKNSEQNFPQLQEFLIWEFLNWRQTQRQWKDKERWREEKREG